MTGDKIRGLLKRLAETVKPGWTLSVNGLPMPDVREMELAHPKFGVLRYGQSPAGPYDQWGFEEIGFGGSVLVPFVEKNRLLHVGVVNQPRPFQADQPVWNVPRGFLDPGQNHFETAVREMAEEMAKVKSERVFLLPGEGGNPNSTFFVGGGVKFYGVRFHLAEVEELLSRELTLKPGAVKAVTKDAERIMGAKFLPLFQVAELGDLFSVAAVARLMAWKAKQK